MSATALTLAAILALATDPRCGAAAPGSEFASRLAAIAIHESGGDPLAINVNGPGGGTRRFATATEAVAFARALDAQGRDYDAGLMQVNRRQFARHGLTVETAFDACTGIAAGADHYAEDVRAVWTLAHRRYNTGSTERGAAYAAGVEQVLARVRARQATLPASTEPLTLTPQQPPAAPPCAPSWDAWALAECSARQAAPPAPQPAEDISSAPVITAIIGDPNAADPR